MSELTIDEIKKIFFMYYGQRVLKFSDAAPATQIVDEFMMNRWIAGCKLSLTPLSEISDEDAESVGYIIFLNEKGSVHPVQIIQWVKNTLKSKNKYDRLSFDPAQYLIQCGYAVPLFFGIGHWANGKTAIELNIAIPNP